MANDDIGVSDADLVNMFGDVAGDPNAVEQRRRDLLAWTAAHHSPSDDLPTTGAPDA
jgi:hypothetical protein